MGGDNRKGASTERAKDPEITLHEEKPEGVENESVEQVAFADRILLNKCDLVDEKTLEVVQKAIRGINANAEIIHSQYSQVRGFTNVG